MWKCRNLGIWEFVCHQKCKDKLRTREITKECAATECFASALETRLFT